MTISSVVTLHAEQPFGRASSTDAFELELVATRLVFTPSLASSCRALHDRPTTEASSSDSDG